MKGKLSDLKIVLLAIAQIEWNFGYMTFAKWFYKFENQLYLFIIVGQHYYLNDILPYESAA